MEWSEDKTLSLIEIYRERPLIWNSRLANYKNRNKRHDALLEISVSFGTDKDEIDKKKIRQLLSHFSVRRSWAGIGGLNKVSFLEMVEPINANKVTKSVFVMRKKLHKTQITSMF